MKKLNWKLFFRRIGVGLGAVGAGVGMFLFTASLFLLFAEALKISPGTTLTFILLIISFIIGTILVDET